MKIINLGRGQGKTTRLLYANEFQDTPILCASHKQKEHLLQMAKELKLKIPEPIVPSELVQCKFKGSDVIYKDILVDEAPWVLRCLLESLGVKGEVKAITLTADDTY